MMVTEGNPVKRICPELDRLIEIERQRLINETGRDITTADASRSLAMNIHGRAQIHIWRTKKKIGFFGY